MTTSAFGFSTINGLPAHVLIVHLVVVFVPLTAVMLVAAALHPRTARRMGLALPGAAAVSLLSVFAAMNAGDWLEQHVGSSQQLHHHTELGGQLWPFSLAVLLISLAVWWFARTPAPAPDAVAVSAARDSGAMARVVATGLLAVVAATLSVVWVVRIGDSGSRAAWHDSFSHSAVGHGDGDG